MALHLAKRFGPLTDLVRSGGWAQRNQVAVGDLEGSTIGIVGNGRQDFRAFFRYYRR